MPATTYSSHLLIDCYVERPYVLQSGWPCKGELIWRFDYAYADQATAQFQLQMSRRMGHPDVAYRLVDSRTDQVLATA